GDPRPGAAAAPSGENLRVEGAAEIGPEVRRDSSASEGLEDPEGELVSICTPTDTHAALTVDALEGRKHVLLEKPVATSVEEVRRVGVAAHRNGRLITPGMCMRFWPGWTWLKERIAEGGACELGRVVGVTFARMGPPPSWSPEFYLDADRSGG